MVETSISHRTASRLNSCLQRLQRSKSLKLFRETISGDGLPQQSKFGRTSQATKSACKSAESLTRSRKRDRIRNYLVRRRETKASEALPYLTRPAILSTYKEEIRSSDDTEDGDDIDVYMVDCESDSDSDDESGFEDDFITPPVTIPEIYRRQDRLSGVIVAGVRILFTYAGFKRQQTMVHKLQSVPEGTELTVLVGLHHEHIVIGAF